MTAAVAHPLTALRVLRRAGRRRALRVVFFLGGLLALGFLWGGQAYAAEAPSPLRDSTDAVDAIAQLVPDVPVDVPAQRKPAAREAGQAVREIAEPVADVVRGVARPVGELRDRVAEHRPAVPGLPQSPVALAPPVPELPVPTGQAAVPVPPSGGGTEPSVTPEKAVHQGSGDRAQPAASGSAARTTGQVEPGAYPYELSAPQGDDAERGPGRPECGEVPVQAPAGPCGDGVRQTAGDGNPSRSGDKHAAPFAHGARLGLVRGATLPATASPTYDRPHEILEFPG
ncbi:hypothetical protein [Streptomyces sp. NPDC055287]